MGALGDRVSLRFVLSGWKKRILFDLKVIMKLESDKHAELLLPSLILKCLSAGGDVIRVS